MRKVIQISNEPSFFKGVKSFVLSCDPIAGRSECGPYLSKAKDYTNESEEAKNLDLYHIKSGFPKATVELIEIE